MARRIFFSFHFKADSWRAGQVRNTGVLEGNAPVTDNDWEDVKKGGAKAIENWINQQMRGRSCTVVLVGDSTAGRRWIKYEIIKTWNDGKGLVGIRIHNLKDRAGEQSKKGRNPFDDITVGKTRLSNIVKLYDPPYKRSENVYNYIKNNIAKWIEEAITIRANYDK